MKHFYLFYKSLLFSLAIVLGMENSVMAQVGFNNPNPDSTALIDMKANDKGLLVPRMTTLDRDNMTKNGKRPANALLVFDTDLKLFFFYDTVTVPNRWVALNPWISQGAVDSDIVTATNGNVGIGTTTDPSAKLEVNGTIKASGNVSTTGNISSGSVTTTGNLTAASVSSGSITSTSTVTANSFVGNGTIPLGGIIMWSGSTPPVGWALCNGQTVSGVVTPDLRGRFVIGAGTYTESSGSYTYNVGNTGGEAKHAMTVAEMPKHVHNINMLVNYGGNGTPGGEIVGGNAGGGDKYRFDNKNSDYTGGNGTQSDGNGQYHENRPPYYTLAYIIRVQ
jgi:microcystin-dependent protein